MGPQSDEPPYTFINAVVLLMERLPGLPEKQAPVVASTLTVPPLKLHPPRHTASTLLPAQHPLSPIVTIYLTGPRNRCLSPPFVILAHNRPVNRRASASLLFEFDRCNKLAPMTVCKSVCKLTFERLAKCILLASTNVLTSPGDKLPQLA